MVIPSSSAAALSRPHIGSAGGGGTFFAAIPESQWPALPTQQGIASFEALAIGASVAKNDRATKKHKNAFESCLCFMCSIANIYY
jgi:hypothetical protein